MNSTNKPITGWFVAGSVLWTVLLSASLYLNYSNGYKQSIKLASIEALAHFNKDTAFRFWATSHGGVYVPISETTPPSPRLSHIPERDITTPSGKRLTLMNPAYMLRQMMSDYAELYGVKGKITTFPDKLFYLGNMPDAWELDALHSFQQGNKEVKEITYIKGVPHLRLMRPLFIKQGCLKCHSAQGYKVGDVRGGVGVSVPMKPYLDAEQEKIIGLSYSHFILWIVGLLGLIYFYTRIKKYNKSIGDRESELRIYEHIVSSSSDMEIFLDKEATFLAANPAYLKAFNKTQNEIIGYTISELFGEEPFNNMIRLHAEKCLNGNDVMYQEFFEFPAYDSPRFMDIHCYPHFNGSDEVSGFAVNARDITEKKQAESTLQTLVSSTSGKLGEAYYKGAVENLYRWLGADAVLLSKLVGQGRVETLAAMIDGEFVEYVYDLKGTPCENVVDNSVCNYSENIIQLFPEDRDLVAMKVESYIGVPIKDNTGNPVGILCALSKEKYKFSPNMESVLTIVASRAGAEMERSVFEEQFNQAQKMDALGTLVGGIAHDFNNMLAGITGNLYLIKKKTADMPEVEQKLVTVEQLSFRAADMIQQLLTFARKGMVKMSPLPFSPFIKETIKFLATSVPENISFNHDICSDEILISGDATQLHQVLMNLLNNARDAVEGVENPCINITLKKFSSGSSLIQADPYFIAGQDYAYLSINDNGYGISKENIAHLFEPFFSTKEEGKGTGLGLAMVFGAIKTHHGYINVESNEGKGSTFHIYLPLATKDERASTAIQDSQLTEAGHGETILLVDDNIQVREIGKEILGSLGYKVIEASDGVEAVDKFMTHKDELSLIIMDVVMPKLGGMEAAKQIWKVTPGIKVIFSTGYDKDAALLKTALPYRGVTITKPYNVEEFSRVIREQLASH